MGGASAAKSREKGAGGGGARAGLGRGYGDGVAEFDVDAMIQRFRERAQAVKNRPLPPVAGAERQEFIRRAQLDYQDFAIVADAAATVEDGILVLRVDLRPPDQRGDASSS
jgi:limonene-1,2-epoxide hydrolase